MVDRAVQFLSAVLHVSVWRGEKVAILGQRVTKGPAHTRGGGGRAVDQGRVQRYHVIPYTWFHCNTETTAHSIRFTVIKLITKNNVTL